MLNSNFDIAYDTILSLKERKNAEKGFRRYFSW